MTGKITSSKIFPYRSNRGGVTEIKGGEEMLSIILKEGTDSVVQKELSQDSEQQERYLNDLWMRIQREDKFLANFIKNFSAQSEDPAATIYACALVWKLLEAQEQANVKNLTNECNDGGYL